MRLFFSIQATKHFIQTLNIFYNYFFLIISENIIYVVIEKKIIKFLLKINNVFTYNKNKIS